MKNNRFVTRSNRAIVVRILTATLLLAVMTTMMAAPTFATGLQDHQIFKGGMSLLKDLMTVATIACPIIGGLAAVFFLIRRSMADEQDGKMWMKRVYTAVACGVGGALVTGVIALGASYFSG